MADIVFLPGLDRNIAVLPRADYSASSTTEVFNKAGYPGLRLLFDLITVPVATQATATATLGFGIDTIGVDTGGSAYTAAPTVVITGDGTGATATAVLTADAVTSVTVDTAGSGYTEAPTISFTGGGGTGATATAVLLGSGAVKSITITNGGANYQEGDPPDVSFASGGGTGAAATVTEITDGVITQITLDNGGSSYETPPDVTIEAPPAVGTVTVTIQGRELTSGSDTKFTILASAAHATSGLKQLNVHPALTGSANAIAKDWMPTEWFLQIDHSGVGTWEYGVTAQAGG